jgi:hypothetical protein
MRGGKGIGIQVSRAPLRVTGSHISGFRRAGVFAGNVVIEDSTISANGTAGVQTFGESARIEDSTLTGNTVGLQASYTDDAVIVNSTLSGNGDPDFLGSAAVFADTSNVLIRSSTIAGTAMPAATPGTVPGAIWSTFSSRIEIRDSIVAGTEGPTCSEDPFGEVVFRRGNVIDDASGCPQSGYAVAEPGLGPLAGNGGPTETHAIGPASPAVGAASQPAPEFDQRGVPRDEDPDAGAFEAPAPTRGGPNR